MKIVTRQFREKSRKTSDTAQGLVLSFEKRQKTDRNSLVVPNRAKNKAKKRK